MKRSLKLTATVDQIWTFLTGIIVRLIQWITAFSKKLEMFKYVNYLSDLFSMECYSKNESQIHWNFFHFLKQYKALRIWNYRRSEILWCLLRSFLCALMRCQRRSFKCNLMMEYHNPLNLVERLFHQNAVDITMQNCKVKGFWFE